MGTITKGNSSACATNANIASVGWNQTVTTTKDLIITPSFRPDTNAKTGEPTYEIPKKSLSTNAVILNATLTRKTLTYSPIAVSSKSSLCKKKTSQAAAQYLRCLPHHLLHTTPSLPGPRSSRTARPLLRRRFWHLLRLSDNPSIK